VLAAQRGTGGGQCLQGLGDTGSSSRGGSMKKWGEGARVMGPEGRNQGLNGWVAAEQPRTRHDNQQLGGKVAVLT